MYALFIKVDREDWSTETQGWMFKGFTEHEEIASEFEDEAKLDIDDGRFQSYRIVNLDD